MELRVMFFVVLLGCLSRGHGQTAQTACSVDDLTALYQKGFTVSDRSHGAHHGPTRNLVSLPKREHHSGTIAKSTGAATLAQSAVLPDHGWSIEGSVPVSGEARNQWDVLATCIGVILLVSIGWAIYWCTTRTGRESEKFKLALFIASFGVCSWGMNVVNMSLVRRLDAPILVTGAQMTMTVLSTVLLAWHRITGSMVEVFKWSIIPLIFGSMLMSSFFTYKYMPLTMLMVIRSVGPLITLPIESLVLPRDKRPAVTMQMLIALGIIVASAIVYCHDITVSVRGVMFAILNMILAVTDRVAQRRLLTTECQGLSTETCLFLNSFLGLIPVAILSVCLGEWKALDPAMWCESMNTVLLVLSGIIGTAICYFAIAVQREISATSFVVLQNLVRMSVVLMGVIVFLDPIGWPYQICGLALSFIGAIWYGKAQVDSAMEQARANGPKQSKSSFGSQEGQGDAFESAVNQPSSSSSTKK